MFMWSFGPPPESKCRPWLALAHLRPEALAPEVQGLLGELTRAPLKGVHDSLRVDIRQA